MADIRLVELVQVGGVVTYIDHDIIGQAQNTPVDFPSADPNEEYSANDHPWSAGHIGWEALWEEQGKPPSHTDELPWDSTLSHLRRLHIIDILG